MVSVDQIIGFGAAALVLILIPGPSAFFTISRAISYGSRVALATVLGNVVGLLGVMTLVTVGLGTITERATALLTVLKWAGAAYLVWLGVQALRSRRTLTTTADPEGTSPSRITAVRQGLVVGATNPKAFMIVTALLPPFVDPSRGSVAMQMFLLGSIAVALGFICDAAWALTAGQVRDWFAVTPRRSIALSVIGGGTMIGLGAALAIGGHS